MRLVLSALFVGLVAVGYIAVASQQVANPSIAGILTGTVVDSPQQRSNSVSRRSLGSPYGDARPALKMAKDPRHVVLHGSGCCSPLEHLQHALPKFRGRA